RRSVGDLAGRMLGYRPGSAGRRGEFDGEIQSARRRADANPDTWRDLGRCRRYVLPDVWILMHGWWLRAGGHGCPPGAFHGQRHRPGNVDHNRGGLLDCRLPDTERWHRHRADIRPPTPDGIEAGERGQGGAAVAADDRGQRHLAGLLTVDGQPARPEA